MIQVKNIEKLDTTKYSEGSFFISKEKLYVIINGQLMQVTLKKMK